MTTHSSHSACTARVRSRDARRVSMTSPSQLPGVISQISSMRQRSRPNIIRSRRGSYDVTAKPSNNTIACVRSRKIGTVCRTTSSGRRSNDTPTNQTESQNVSLERFFSLIQGEVLSVNWTLDRVTGDSEVVSLQQQRNTIRSLD